MRRQIRNREKKSLLTQRSLKQIFGGFIVRSSVAVVVVIFFSFV